LFRTLNNGVNGTPDGGELEVDAAGAGLAVDIAAGQAMVRGHFYISTDTEERALTVADSVNDRIDTIVLRLDPVANNVLLTVKTGVPDPAPVAPALVQTDGGVFEQPLANVLVPANAGVPGTITDRREFMGTKLGTWTTAGRPIPNGRPLFGFNTTDEVIEYYDPIAEDWEPVAATIDNLDDIGDVVITTPADGEVLTYDGSDWVNEAIPAGGKILQVVSVNMNTTFTTASTSMADITGLTATITPSSASNDVLVIVSVMVSNTVAGDTGQLQLADGSDNVLAPNGAPGSRSEGFHAFAPNVIVGAQMHTFNFLHSPATTSAFTYKVRARRVSPGTVVINRSGSADDDSGRLAGSSTITLMEVAG